MEYANSFYVYILSKQLVAGEKTRHRRFYRPTIAKPRYRGESYAIVRRKRFTTFIPLFTRPYG